MPPITVLKGGKGMPKTRRELHRHPEKTNIPFGDPSLVARSRFSGSKDGAT
jgi:hypothetical protein